MFTTFATSTSSAFHSPMTSWVFPPFTKEVTTAAAFHPSVTSFSGIPYSGSGFSIDNLPFTLFPPVCSTSPSAPPPHSVAFSHSIKKSPPPFRPFVPDIEDPDATSDPSGIPSEAVINKDFAGNEIKASDYRRMLNYVTSLYPQSLGSLEEVVDNRAFFERIYDPNPKV